MERPENSVGEDDTTTEMEKVKNVSKKEETKEKVETFRGPPTLRAALNQHVSPPRKERRAEDQEKKERLLNGPPGPIPKIFTHDTVTAWEKRPSLKEGGKVRPPSQNTTALNTPGLQGGMLSSFSPYWSSLQSSISGFTMFSRLLSNLGEEHLAAEKRSPQALEPLKEQSEDLTPSTSHHGQLTALDEEVPVNFFVPRLHRSQQITSVETVEPQRRQEENVPSTSRAAETRPPSAESKKKESPRGQFPRVQKMYAIHTKLVPDRESLAPAGTYNTVWNMGQRISHWKLAHQRGYHMDQITHDKIQKHMIMKHERKTKAAVPLPLLEVIEEEALEILKETLKDYRKHLGVNHELTLQIEEQAEKLHLRLKGRGVID